MKDYMLPALSKLWDHFEESTGFIISQLGEYDDGNKRNAKETKEVLSQLIDTEIKELQELKNKANKSLTKFIDQNQLYG